MADFLVFALLVLNLLPLFVTSFTATSTSRITNPASHVVASVRKSSELRVSSTSAPPSRRTKWDENDEDDDEDDADDVAFFITKGTDSSNSLDGSDYLLQT
jgi:hypothetical protein